MVFSNLDKYPPKRSNDDVLWSRNRLVMQPLVMEYQRQGVEALRHQSLYLEN